MAGAGGNLVWAPVVSSLGHPDGRRGPYGPAARAVAREPNQLPHYPMILHRGGFPDGS